MAGALTPNVTGEPVVAVAGPIMMAIGVIVGGVGAGMGGDGGPVLGAAAPTTSTVVVIAPIVTLTRVFAGVVTIVVALPLASVVVAAVETVPFAVENPIGIPATKRPSDVKTVAVTAVV